jgi:hypothetical protein
LEIKDSGNRREFESGAVRDIQEGKGRCDLLPLSVLAKIYLDKTDKTSTGRILTYINSFILNGDVGWLELALEEYLLNDSSFDDCNWSTLFLEVSKHFEEGAKKYGDRNWQKGIPARCYIDSGVRHYLKWLRGDIDEPHNRAFCWNLLCCIWTCLNKPELNDYIRADIHDVCAICGKSIPEGRQICPDCEEGAR